MRYPGHHYQSTRAMYLNPNGSPTIPEVAQHSPDCLESHTQARVERGEGVGFQLQVMVVEVYDYAFTSTT